MKNEKLNKAKTKVRDFCEDHGDAILLGLCAATLIGMFGRAVYNAHKISSQGIRNELGFVLDEGPEDTCVMFGRGSFYVTYNRPQLADLIDQIRSNGCNVTKDGLELLKAVVDNPVIAE